MAYQSRTDEEDDDEVIYDEKTPDAEIASRPLANDVVTPPQSRGADPAIRDFISKNRNAAAQSDLNQDPLMKSFGEDQSRLNEERLRKVQSDRDLNLGVAFSQLAQGANAPKDTGLYSTLAKQNQEVLGSTQEDIENKRKIMQAIEARNEKRADRISARDIAKDYRGVARQDKKDREAKVSEKQLSDINDFDETLGTMKSVLSQLGENKAWTGPIAGRIPDIIAGPEQVPFRAELGRMVDKYRKLITGAGASSQELQKLESRLPKPTDTYENFIAKANNFIETVERNKSTMLKNLKAQGKNVEPFEKLAAEPTQAKETKEVSGSNRILVSNGKETLHIEPSDLADAEKEGYKRL